MEIIIFRDELIAILNSLLRAGEENLWIKEKWHEHPLLIAELLGKGVKISTISKKNYVDMFSEDEDLSDYMVLISAAVKGGGIIESSELVEWENELAKLTVSRNIKDGDKLLWFYYDTSALMRNIFFILREHIPGFLHKVDGNKISGGVLNELEVHEDWRYKEKDMDRLKKFYSGDASIFLKQPELRGRIAWLAETELNYIKKEHGTPPTSNRTSGDTAILTEYFDEMKYNNVDGVLVSCDRMMCKRARNGGMRAWLVELGREQLKDVTTQLEFLANAIYRMAIIYGSVRINDIITINGIWKFKGVDDWENGSVIVDCPDEIVEEIKNLQSIRKLIPSSFFEKKS